MIRKNIVIGNQNKKLTLLEHFIDEKNKDSNWNPYLNYPITYARITEDIRKDNGLYCNIYVRLFENGYGELVFRVFYLSKDRDFIRFTLLRRFEKLTVRANYEHKPCSERRELTITESLKFSDIKSIEISNEKGKECATIVFPEKDSERIVDLIFDKKYKSKSWYDRYFDSVIVEVYLE